MDFKKIWAWNTQVPYSFSGCMDTWEIIMQESVDPMSREDGDWRYFSCNTGSRCCRPGEDEWDGVESPVRRRSYKFSMEWTHWLRKLKNRFANQRCRCIVKLITRNGSYSPDTIWLRWRLESVWSAEWHSNLWLTGNGKTWNVYIDRHWNISREKLQSHEPNWPTCTPLDQPILPPGIIRISVWFRNSRFPCSKRA